MKNETLNQIKSEVARILQSKYGYCGIADSDETAILNSGGDEQNFIVTIKDASALED